MGRIFGAPSGAGFHYRSQRAPHWRLKVFSDLAVPCDLLGMLASTNYATLGQPMTPNLSSLWSPYAGSSDGSDHLLAHGTTSTGVDTSPSATGTCRSTTEPVSRYSNASILLLCGVTGFLHKQTYRVVPNDLSRESLLIVQNVYLFHAPHVGWQFVVDSLEGNWTNALIVGFCLRVFVKSWRGLNFG